ncbi:MAG: aminotransferase class I/II-fold pyridoxal phosphate-dependent enzyme, partial [Bacteroidaceae bacterium]|nr:aminotransferase class I/II-fold pyridoxal phosphate-dependent enzyme [Bacteroidaceae bacterium]
LVAKYEAWMDGTMVKLDEEDNIINFVPKKEFRYEDVDLYYKTVNIYKFSKEFCIHRYIPFLNAYVAALGNNEYYEEVLRAITIINISELKAKSVGNLPWYEIDDVQDMDLAETLFAGEDEKLGKYMRRYGGYWRFENMLDFCYLVNPYFPPKRMRDEIRANFDNLLMDYPSGMSVNSLLAGKYFNIKSDYVVVGNGAAELIKSLMENQQGRIGMIYPTFEEYPHRRAEADIVRFTPDEEDFSYSAQDLMDYFEDKDISQLLLVNPDNPSGNFVPVTDVLRLADWCLSHDIQLIVDESFVDFCDDWENSSLLHNDVLSAHPNLVVVKSISKSYGVPGLRLGVLASNDVALINRMKKDVAIWNINSFAEFYMQIFNKYEADYRLACRRFVTER